MITDARTDDAAVTPFETKVAATVRTFLDKQAAADAALIDRDKIIDTAHREQGISVRMLSPYLRDILVRAGFTDEEIAAAAISEGNVRAALRIRRWEGQSDD